MRKQSVDTHLKKKKNKNDQIRIDANFQYLNDSMRDARPFAYEFCIIWLCVKFYEWEN